MTDQLTEQNLHCMARLLQSAIFAPNQELLYGCRLCKFSSDCHKKIISKKNIGIDDLRIKLQQLTAIDLDYLDKTDKFTN